MQIAAAAEQSLCAGSVTLMSALVMTIVTCQRSRRPSTCSTLTTRLLSISNALSRNAAASIDAASGALNCTSNLSRPMTSDWGSYVAYAPDKPSSSAVSAAGAARSTIWR